MLGDTSAQDMVAVMFGMFVHSYVRMFGIILYLTALEHRAKPKATLPESPMPLLAEGASGRLAVFFHWRGVLQLVVSVSYAGG